jgi:hypothetical protein
VFILDLIARLGDEIADEMLYFEQHERPKQRCELGVQRPALSGGTLATMVASSFSYSE